MLKVHSRKGESHGADELPPLSDVVDSRRGAFHLQRVQVAKMETMATAAVRHAGMHRRWARFVILRSFSVVAISFSLSVSLVWY